MIRCPDPNTLHVHTRRLLWVKSVVLTMRRPLPVFPDKQTFSQADGMSQTCHKQTHAAQQKRKGALLDHLVGAG
jgi:hypothetical protein